MHHSPHRKYGPPSSLLALITSGCGGLKVSRIYTDAEHDEKARGSRCGNAATLPGTRVPCPAEAPAGVGAGRAVC